MMMGIRGQMLFYVFIHVHSNLHEIFTLTLILEPDFSQELPKQCNLIYKSIIYKLI